MPSRIDGDDVPAHGARLVETERAAGAVKSDRLSPEMPLREKFAALRARYPLPPPTGLKADKAFFDELSGD